MRAVSMSGMQLSRENERRMWVQLAELWLGEPRGHVSTGQMEQERAHLFMLA